MKKQITFLILVFTISLSAQIKNEYYENGQIKFIGNLKSGAKDGQWKQYYENGKLKNEGNYSNGKKVGEWKLYYETGKINAAGKYDLNGFPIANSWKIYSKEGVVEDFDCPEPTKSMYSSLCHTIYERQSAIVIGPQHGYAYHEVLWEMSCAKYGIDDIDIFKIKLQIMWNKYRKNFRCYDYPTLQGSEKNIMKFAIDAGFTTIITESIKRWDLDMNFIDPGDGGTILDFISTQEKQIRNSPPIDVGRANEYQRIYQLLKTNGAKHSSELNK